MVKVTKELALTVLASCTLSTRLGGLWRVASRKGKKAVVIQWFLVAITLSSKHIRKMLERVPSILVPSLAVSALSFELIARHILKARKIQHAARKCLWAVITFGMVPELVEAANQGLSALTSGEVDIPALIAMQLGLCLNQARAAAVILLMLTGGEAFEEHALDRAGHSLHSLLSQSPGKAHRVNTDLNEIEDVDAEEVKPGDIIMIKTGEVVPVDGVIDGFETQCVPSFDESVLTGEGIPVNKQKGQEVMAGSHLVGGACRVAAVAYYQDSVVSRMKAELSKALNRKASLELKSKRFAGFFTPLTFGFAAAACYISDWRGLCQRQLWEAVLAVFMSATPCPAAIGVPIAMLSGMSVASRRHGATIKAGIALEGLADCSVVVLDKTGTLTEGNPQVKTFTVAKSRLGADLEVLRLVASAEQYSTHPLALAVCSYYKERMLGCSAVNEEHYSQHSFRLPVAQICHHDGSGIAAVLEKDDLQVFVGTRKFCFDDQGFASSDGHYKDVDIEAFFAIAKNGDLYAYGRFTFEDQLRPSARKVVNKLQNEMGVRVMMLSGDRSEHLSRVAQDLGIAEFASCWPHEKAEMVNSLRKDGHIVLMVGDGSNDSAALAAANVGMSIGVSNLAAESASVVLLNDDLLNIAALMSLSKNVVRVAKETVSVGMSISLCLMMCAATGVTTPFISAVAQECVDLGAVFSSLRALR
mmetsp:Transcript_16146/g.31205  ORF Transcript_16146/g.31205 Transcript_16146/m.31205 type:complete len:701 (+) Transcript_16146:399-2501(+)|eukprot:CAMPEP_0171574292 /NCGR_PEP_ID=MMETSP0961-20121227/5265_1 /TAXON_ID=87120 /ORGANISM="Aurantiochytrium limacinum, Strain ATCCMYA-1381" /LENGTH=700 /DNA_ID=CAMNT_0012129569 /DNA_START=312 /DNA_END=2414 /DNA_ORIENTATION=+